MDVIFKAEDDFALLSSGNSQNVFFFFLAFIRTVLLLYLYNAEFNRVSNFLIIHILIFKNYNSIAFLVI